MIEEIEVNVINDEGSSSYPFLADQAQQVRRIYEWGLSVELLHVAFDFDDCVISSATNFKDVVNEMNRNLELRHLEFRLTVIVWRNLTTAAKHMDTTSSYFLDDVKIFFISPIFIIIFFNIWWKIFALTVS